jgi:hypothetical protein
MSTTLSMTICWENPCSFQNPLTCTFKSPTIYGSIFLDYSFSRLITPGNPQKIELWYSYVIYSPIPSVQPIWKGTLKLKKSAASKGITQSPKRFSRRMIVVGTPKQKFHISQVCEVNSANDRDIGFGSCLQSGLELGRKQSTRNEQGSRSGISTSCLSIRVEALKK